jgi:hypothetical protein
MEEIDIWRSAKFLIDCHGQSALREAALRLGKCQAGLDFEGARNWARIHQAVAEWSAFPSRWTTYH